MDLATILSGLVSGTATVPVASWVFNNWRGFKNLSKNQKRATAFAICFILSGVAYLASIYLGYTQAPVSQSEWVEKLWLLVPASFTASQAALSAWKSTAVQAVRKRFSKNKQS